jgi:hypothetical protein
MVAMTQPLLLIMIKITAQGVYKNTTSQGRVRGESFDHPGRQRRRDSKLVRKTSVLNKII